jgi:hypothetical protein
VSRVGRRERDGGEETDLVISEAMVLSFNASVIDESAGICDNVVSPSTLWGNDEPPIKPETAAPM